MIDLAKWEMIETRVATLASTESTPEAGSAMVHVLENGVARVKRSAGVANEVFVGFAFGRSVLPTVAPYTEQLTVPAVSTYTVPLSKSLNGSALLVSVVNTDGSRTPLTLGSAANATEYSISSGVITVNSAQASKVLEVTYKYNVSSAEAQTRYMYDGFSPTLIMIDTVGLISTGEVFIDNFDVASNWYSVINASVTVKLAAGGTVSLSGSGVALPVIVTQVPGVNSPFLGLRVNPA